MRRLTSVEEEAQRFQQLGRESVANHPLQRALTEWCTHRSIRETCGSARAREADHAFPRYLPNSYRYSTNDITAPSKPCTFGLADSMT